MSMNIDKVHQNIESHRESDLELLKKLVRIPSVAAKNQGIDECRDALVSLLEGLGAKTSVLPTKGAPVVFGEIDCGKPDAKTVMFYGHYDVQPPEPLEGWKTPPFEPTVIKGRLYGRGTADNKGQFRADILAVRSYIESGEGLPINIKYFLEGEEENSSMNILDCIVPNKEKLKCDLVYNSDGGMHDSGKPIVQHGVRGMLQVKIDITTARQDNHSGNKGGQIPNAAWEMVKLLSSMIDENGRCAIEGFYDDVVAPSDYDMELINRMEFNPEAVAKIYGVDKILLDKEDFYLNLMFQPTFNINGLDSGYNGVGYRTIIPGSASVKIDMRLVDNQTPDDIYKKIVAHVEKHCPGAKISIGSTTLPSSTKTDLPVCKAVARGVANWWKVEPILMPRVGATNPEYVFTKIAGLPSVCVPYANADESNHAPNENMTLECFYNGIHTSAEVIKEIGML